MPLIVGEAYGAEEDKVQMPFIGRAGEILNYALTQAGLDRNDFTVTNVFNQRPPENDVKYFFGYMGDADVYVFNKKPVKVEFIHEIDRLVFEVQGMKDKKIAVTLGGTALWALCGTTKLGESVGTAQRCVFEDSVTVVPCYHPAYILRNRSMMDTFINQLSFAKEIIDDAD